MVASKRADGVARTFLDSASRKFIRVGRGPDETRELLIRKCAVLCRAHNCFIIIINWFSAAGIVLIGFEYYFHVATVL